MPEERPIARPQDLDPLQLAQHAGDPLGLIPVLDLQRDLAHRSLAADTDRGHVPDQAVPVCYRPGDLGQLPRTVRYLDAIRVVEWQSKPPTNPITPAFPRSPAGRPRCPPAWLSPSESCQGVPLVRIL